MNTLRLNGMRLLLGMLLFTASPGLADEPPPIRVTLVSETTAIAPGKPFHIGIHQVMQPGFHTYWRNPGTIGMPLRIEWRLPAGFSAGPIQWPTPIITHMAAYRVWGYENEALMVVRLQAPPELKPGISVELRGNASWMCCGKACHPGHAELSIRLPVANSAAVDPKWQSRFDRTRSQQPVALVDWKLTCRKQNGVYELRVRPPDQRKLPRDFRARFFGHDRLVSSDKAPMMANLAGGLVFRLPAEKHSPEEHDRLTGILVAGTHQEWAPGCRVLAVDVPIQGR